MPAVQRYVVTQERKVTVTATSPTDAIKLAELSFSMSEEDNRDNNHPVPVETDISASLF